LRDFKLRYAFQDALKWLEIDQDNMYMKCSALKISPNPLGSTRVAQAGIKEGHLFKKWLFIRCWLI